MLFTFFCLQIHHYYDLNKNLDLQTWFHSFFLVGDLVLDDIFNFSKFKKTQILPKTSILMVLLVLLVCAENGI